MQTVNNRETESQHLNMVRDDHIRKGMYMQQNTRLFKSNTMSKFVSPVNHDEMCKCNIFTIFFLICHDFLEYIDQLYKEQKKVK